MLGSLIYLFFVWSLVGGFIWAFPDGPWHDKESDMSVGQVIFIGILGGPLVWAWRLAALIGPRNKS